MMTAKEMFKELGFKQTKCINEKWPEHAQIEYECVTDDKYIKRSIIFIQKGFYAQLYYYDFNIVGVCIVTSEMLKAINQQMKELGWIE